MTNKRIFWYLEKEKKIDDRQLGFRKQSSTIDTISKITTIILDGFKKKEKIAAIFFDIKKAYDKVNREKILEQLEKIRIQGRMIKLYKELLGERWSKVIVGGYISQSIQTVGFMGSREGSGLLPQQNSKHDI